MHVIQPERDATRMRLAGSSRTQHGGNGAVAASTITEAASTAVAASTITNAAESARRAVECAGFQGECAVCFEQPARFAILLPCTHMCVCFDCAQRLTACPVCRVPIRARQPFLMAMRPASAEI